MRPRRHVKACGAVRRARNPCDDEERQITTGAACERGLEYGIDPHPGSRHLDPAAAGWFPKSSIRFTGTASLVAGRCGCLSAANGTTRQVADRRGPQPFQEKTWPRTIEAKWKPGSSSAH